MRIVTMLSNGLATPEMFIQAGAATLFVSSMAIFFKSVRSKIPLTDFTVLVIASGITSAGIMFLIYNSRLIQVYGIIGLSVVTVAPGIAAAYAIIQLVLTDV